VPGTSSELAIDCEGLFAGVSLAAARSPIRAGRLKDVDSVAIAPAVAKLTAIAKPSSRRRNPRQNRPWR